MKGGHRKYRRSLVEIAKRIAEEEGVMFVEVEQGSKEHYRISFKVNDHEVKATASATPAVFDHGLNFARQQMRRAIVAEKTRQEKRR